MILVPPQNPVADLKIYWRRDMNWIVWSSNQTRQSDMLLLVWLAALLLVEPVRLCKPISRKRGCDAIAFMGMLTLCFQKSPFSNQFLKVWALYIWKLAIRIKVMLEHGEDDGEESLSCLRGPQDWSEGEVEQTLQWALTAAKKHWQHQDEELTEAPATSSCSLKGDRCLSVLSSEKRETVDLDKHSFEILIFLFRLCSILRSSVLLGGLRAEERMTNQTFVVC